MSTSGGGVGTLLGAGGKGLQGSILNLFPERFSLALWRNVPVPHPLSYQVEKKKYPKKQQQKPPGARLSHSVSREQMNTNRHLICEAMRKRFVKRNFLALKKLTRRQTTPGRHQRWILFPSHQKCCPNPFPFQLKKLAYKPTLYTAFISFVTGMEVPLSLTSEEISNKIWAI